MKINMIKIIKSSDGARQAVSASPIIQMSGSAGTPRRFRPLAGPLTPTGTLVIVASEVGGRLQGGFDRNLRAVALSRLVSPRLRHAARSRGSRTSRFCGGSSRPASSPL